MNEPFVVTASVFRPNVYLDVKPVGAYNAHRIILDALLPLKKAVSKPGDKTTGKSAGNGPSGSAMIYFMTRKTADKMGQELKDELGQFGLNVGVGSAGSGSWSGQGSGQAKVRASVRVRGRASNSHCILAPRRIGLPRGDE
jgi:superfamily II DNA helicase RecQ